MLALVLDLCPTSFRHKTQACYYMMYRYVQYMLTIIYIIDFCEVCVLCFLSMPHLIHMYSMLSYIYILYTHNLLSCRCSKSTSLSMCQHSSAVDLVKISKSPSGKAL